MWDRVRLVSVAEEHVISYSTNSSLLKIGEDTDLNERQDWRVES